MNLILAQTGFLPSKWELLLYGIGGVLLLVVAGIVINFGTIYIRALFSGAKVTITELIALRLRRVPAGLVVDNRIAAVRSGLPLSIDGVAKDGIVIKARALVTVRTNLDRFVGGATEETIIARVGEGIVSTIGSSTTYKDVLENPHRISRTVLDKALDANTAFEILSLDIADVDVGENVGAKLQAEQAEANKLIAQAHAEIRRAAAVAVEQEMTARVAEMRARVVEAEATVPLGMAAAFRSGHLGFMN